MLRAASLLICGLFLLGVIGCGNDTSVTTPMPSPLGPPVDNPNSPSGGGGSVTPGATQTGEGDGYGEGGSFAGGSVTPGDTQANEGDDYGEGGSFAEGSVSPADSGADDGEGYAGGEAFAEGSVSPDASGGNEGTGYENGFDPSGGGPLDGQGGNEGGYPEGFDPGGGRAGRGGGDRGGAGAARNRGGRNRAGGGDGNSRTGGNAPGGSAPGGNAPGGNAGGDRAGNQASVAPSKKPSADGLLGQYEQALSEGREKDAFQILYAMALTEESSDLLEKIHWVNGLRRPTLGVRFGIGVDLARDFDGNAYPIGTEQNIPEKNSRRGGDGFEGYEGGADSNAFPGAGGGGGGPGRGDLLTRYTGELGDQLIERLGNSVGKGHFGEVLLAATEFVGLRRDSGGSGGGGNNGYEDSGTGGDGFDGGNGGAGGASEPSNFGGGGRAGGQREDDDQSEPSAILAGVTMLGKGSLRELLTTAQSQNLDVLVVFHVSIKKNNRTGFVTNDTRMSLYDVRRGTNDGMLKNAGSLNNIKVQIARRDAKQGRDTDMVESAFNKLFTYVDGEEGLKVGVMPEGLKAEHVLARVQELVKTTPENPLPAMVEIKYYHSRDLMSVDHMTMAFQKLIGDADGAKLVEGNQAERLAAIEKWIP